MLLTTSSRLGLELESRSHRQPRLITQLLWIDTGRVRMCSNQLEPSHFPLVIGPWLFTQFLLPVDVRSHSSVNTLSLILSEPVLFKRDLVLLRGGTILCFATLSWG